MQNFSAIRTAVRKPFQKNSWEGRIDPPARARVKQVLSMRNEVKTETGKYQVKAQHVS